MSTTITKIEQDAQSIFVDGIVDGVVVKGAEGFVSRFNSLAHDAARQTAYLETLLKAHVATDVKKFVQNVNIVTKVKNFVHTNSTTIWISTTVSGTFALVEFIVRHLVK